MTKTITYLQNKDLFIYSTDDYLSYDEVKAIQAGYESQLDSRVAVLPMCSEFRVVTSQSASDKNKDDHHLSPASTELLLSIMEADKELQAGAKIDVAIPIQSYHQKDIDTALLIYHKITGARYYATVTAGGEPYLLVSRERYNGDN